MAKRKLGNEDTTQVQAASGLDEQSKVSRIEEAEPENESNEYDPIITLAEAARQIGKHPSTVTRWNQQGLFASVKLPSGLPGIRQSIWDAAFPQNEFSKK